MGRRHDEDAIMEKRHDEDAMKNEAGMKNYAHKSNREAGRKTFRDLRFYFPVIVTQGLIGLVSAALITKLFRAQDYGRYVLAFTFYSQLTLFTSLWLQYSIIRFAPQYRVRDRFREFASTILFTEIAFSCCLAFILPILLTTLGRGTGSQVFPLMVVAVAGALILPFVSAMEQFYRIEDRPNMYCRVVLFRILCGPVLGLLLGKGLGLGIMGFFSGVLAPNLILFVLFLHSKRKEVKWLLRRHLFSFPIAREAIFFSAPLVVTSLISSSLVLSDRYLIGWFCSAGDVALYSIAYVLANQGMELITTVLLGAADPIAIRMWEERGPGSTNAYLTQLLRYYSLFATPAAVGLALLGRQLIPILSTSDYARGWQVMGYVAFAILFCGYAQILSRVFLLRKRTVAPVLIYGSAAAVNILLNVLLIPRFGYMAAAWTTLGSYFLLFSIVALVVAPSTLSGFSILPYARMAASALFMGSLLYVIRDAFGSVWLNLGLCLPAGALTYFLALIVTREIDIKDVSRLLRRALLLLRSPFRGRKPSCSLASPD